MNKLGNPEYRCSNDGKAGIRRIKKMCVHDYFFTFKDEHYQSLKDDYYRELILDEKEETENEENSR